MMSTRRPAQRAAGVEDLERLAQGRERFAARDAGLPAEGVERGVGAGQRAGVAVRRACRRRGAARLDERDGLAGSARLRRGVREALRVLDALEIQPEGADARIVAQTAR